MEKKKESKSFLQPISVGIMVAATGIGAGDIVMAALAGADYGMTLLWAVLLGALLKFVLNEELAKWDIATGMTLLQGWTQRLPKWVSIYFACYLIFWAFTVAGSLITFTGLVANTIFPLPVADNYALALWGGLHSMIAVVLIYAGGFSLVEKVMKVFIILMFFIVIVCAVLLSPDWEEVLQAIFIPKLSFSSDALFFVFALIGGIGGSVSILCYSYWIAERQQGSKTLSLKEVRVDLGVSYFLTAIFGMAIIIIAASLRPGALEGYSMVLGLSTKLGDVLGKGGKWVFLLGFWGAVYSSMLGVWNGIPYLFVDLVKQFKSSKCVDTKTKVSYHNFFYYRLFLLYMAIPPILLPIFGRPNWIGKTYALTGAFFIPFIAALLLYMNNKKAWVREYRNGWLMNTLLIICLLLFFILFLVEVKQVI